MIGRARSALSALVAGALLAGCGGSPERRIATAARAVLPGSQEGSAPTVILFDAPGRMMGACMVKQGPLGPEPDFAETIEVDNGEIRFEYRRFWESQDVNSPAPILTIECVVPILDHRLELAYQAPSRQYVRDNKRRLEKQFEEWLVEIMKRLQ